MVANRLHRLADNLQRQLFQQRISEQHRSGKGIFHRQQGIVRLPVHHCLGRLLEGCIAHARTIREDRLRRAVGEAPRCARIGDHKRHPARSFHRSRIAMAVIASITGTARGKMQGS